MAFTFKEFKSKEISSLPHYLVIGHPIGHSLSPLMHQAALDYHHLNAQYFAIDLHSDDITDFISWLNRDTFLGCNITIPYKELFIDVVDRLDPTAAHLGVINTIAKSGSELIGYNTDVHGFLQPLEQFRDDLEGSAAIIFGTGGASKAVMAGLISSGITKILFVSRNVKTHRINKNRADAEIDVEYLDYSQWQAYIDDVSILINATPLGMYPNIAESPVKEVEMELLNGKICYDLVYNPLITTFLTYANRAGGHAIQGHHMLIHQGDHSFNIWTDKSFPLELIYQKIENYFI
jgi:shikimate dehydrogenase